MGTRGGMVTAGTALVVGVLAFGAVQVVQAADADKVVQTSDFGTEVWDPATVLAIRAAQDAETEPEVQPETAPAETGAEPVTEQPEQPVEPDTTSPEPPSGDSWPGPPPVGAEASIPEPVTAAPVDNSPGPPPLGAETTPAPEPPADYYDDTPPPPPVPNP